MKERSTIKPEAEEEDEASGRLAALKIQKVWRGYVTRRWVRKRRLEEMLLIGNVIMRKTKFPIDITEETATFESCGGERISTF